VNSKQALKCPECGRKAYPTSNGGIFCKNCHQIFSKLEDKSEVIQTMHLQKLDQYRTELQSFLEDAEKRIKDDNLTESMKQNYVDTSMRLAKHVRDLKQSLQKESVEKEKRGRPSKHKQVHIREIIESTLDESQEVKIENIIFHLRQIVYYSTTTPAYQQYDVAGDLLTLMNHQEDAGKL